MNKHLLLDVYGTRWTFYTNELNHLCYQRGSAKGEILLKNITAEYDVAIDENGHFHIVLQDAVGSLIYIKYDYNEWKKYVLLKNKHSLPKISNIKIVMADNLPVAFYALEHNGQKLLAEHKIRWGVVTSPIIIDILSKGAVFDVCLDDERCFHLVYKNEQGNAVYKIAPVGAKAFSAVDFPCEHDIVNVRLTHDKYSNLHIIYVANINSYHALFYFSTAGRETKGLAFGISPKSDLLLDVSGEMVRARWVDTDRVFECVSKDNGKSFTKPMFIRKGK